MDSWNSVPSTFSDVAEGAHGFEAHVDLKDQLEEQKLRNREFEQRNQELEQRLSLMNQRLDDEVQKRQVTDLDRQIQIDALRERTEQVREREATIEEQNCLLGLAWTDVQELTASRQETEKTAELLRDYVECVLGSNATDGAGGNKKRRTCS